MQQVNVSAQSREKTGGKGAISSVLGKGMVPAVVYGGEKKPVSVMVVEKEIAGVLKFGDNALIKLKYGSEEENVIIKVVQRHVVTDRVIHLDFQRIRLTDKLKFKVHVKLVGEPQGVKLQGGIMEHALREFNVLCMPTEIPKEIEVDVTALNIGDSIRVKDVKSKVELTDDPNHVVVSVIAAKEEVVETPVAAAAGGAEPEVIAKGKKEEEGAAPAAGAKPAAAGAKPEEKKAEPKK
jgi:large subunit ribosomal protein L25